MKVRDQLSQTKVWRLILHHESISKSIAGISCRFKLGQLYSEAFLKHMSSSYVASLILLKMHVGQKFFLAEKSNGAIFNDLRSIIAPN